MVSEKTIAKARKDKEKRIKAHHENSKMAMAITDITPRYSKKKWNKILAEGMYETLTTSQYLKKDNK